MSCQSKDCLEARERNNQLNQYVLKAKDEAKKDSEAKAVCYDEINGHFITGAKVAIEQHFQIKHIVSSLQ